MNLENLVLDYIDKIVQLISKYPLQFAVIAFVIFGLFIAVGLFFIVIIAVSPMLLLTALIKGIYYGSYNLYVRVTANHISDISTFNNISSQSQITNRKVLSNSKTASNNKIYNRDLNSSYSGYNAHEGTLVFSLNDKSYHDTIHKEYQKSSRVKTTKEKPPKENYSSVIDNSLDSSDSSSSKKDYSKPKRLKSNKSLSFRKTKVAQDDPVLPEWMAQKGRRLL